jgi:hypothetical protein
MGQGPMQRMPPISFVVSNSRSLRNLHKGHQHLLVRFENLKLHHIRETVLDA